MRPVMRTIFEAKRRFERRPLFEHLRDDALTPRERLGFYPAMAPFILAFGDLNAHVLRDETSTDAHQLLVNAHTYEDDHHWPWYLDDLVALGWDAPRSASDVLRAYHDESTVVGRMLAPRLAHLVYGATPIERLVIIEAIEETGNVLFELTAALARRIEAEEGVVLRYLGDFHFELESGHAMNGADHRELAVIVLADGQRERCLELVARVFCLFEAWTDELFAHARATPRAARDRPLGHVLAPRGRNVPQPVEHLAWSLPQISNPSLPTATSA